MNQPNRWVYALRYASVVAVILVVVQYVLGVGTNLFATPFDVHGAGTSNWLEGHFNNGLILGVVSILTIVFAAVSRKRRLLALSAGLTASVVLAGVFGILYEASASCPSPGCSVSDNPAYSFAMAIMFLLALLSGVGLTMESWAGRTPRNSSPLSSAAAAP